MPTAGFFRPATPVTPMHPLILALMLVLVLVVPAAPHLYGQAPDAPATIPPAERDDPQEDELREQTIYIPYDKLQEVFEKQGRGVFLPYEQFQQLWQAARRKRLSPPSPALPADALITRIESTAVIGPAVMTTQARLHLELLKQGWLRIPLRLPDSAIVSAQIDGQPARIVREQSGHYLLIEHPEEKPTSLVLQLEYAKSYQKTPGLNSINVQPPVAPLNRWQIEIAEPDVQIDVHPMLAATQLDGAPEQPPGATTDEPARGTTVLAFVGAAPQVRIQWTPRAEGAEGLEAIASLQALQQVNVTENSVTSLIDLDYSISRAELQKLIVRIPADQKLVAVVDPNVRQWSSSPLTDGRQEITIDLFQPVRTRQRIRLELEKFFSEATVMQIDVPQVEAVAVGRQQGVIAVRLAEGLRAEATRRSNLVQLDREEIPSPMQEKRWNFAYRYSSYPYALALRIEKIRPRIAVTQHVDWAIEPQRMLVTVAARYRIERAGVFELRMTIPDGYEVRNVAGLAQENTQAVTVDTYHVQETDGKMLHINLTSRAIGDVGLLVEMERPLEDVNLLQPTGESSPLQLDVPRAADEHLREIDGRLTVYAPESLRVSTQQPQGVSPIAVREALGQRPSGLPAPPGEAVAAFTFSRQTATLPLSVERRRPLVHVRQLLVANVEPGTVSYRATLSYDIRFSSVSKLLVDLPAVLAPNIRIETSGVRETLADVPSQHDSTSDADSTSKAPAHQTPPGYVRWQLTGQSEWIGQRSIVLIWEEPLDDLEVGKTRSIEVPRLIPIADHSAGEIVLTKAETVDVVPGEPRSGLQPIDPQHDLPEGVRVDNAAAAFQFHNDWQLTLLATRYQPHVLKQTSVENGLLRVVRTRSGRSAFQGLYRLRSNQQRLKIQLPSQVAADHVQFDTQPLRINGQPVSLEQGDAPDVYFVPLPSQGSNLPILMELRYTVPTQTLVSYPHFPDDPAIQRADLLLFLPDDQVYLGSRGGWEPDLTWVVDGNLRHRPVPRRSPDQLYSRLVAGISIAGDPWNDFPVEGQPLLFTTLQPGPPQETPLRVGSIHRRTMQVLLFSAAVLLGVALLRQQLTTLVATLCGLLGLIVVSGTLMPSFTHSMLDVSLLLALVLLACVWFASAAKRLLSQLGHALAGYRAEPTNPAPIRDSRSAAKPPDDRTPGPTREEGGSPSPPQERPDSNSASSEGETS